MKKIHACCWMTKPTFNNEVSFVFLILLQQRQLCQSERKIMLFPSFPSYQFWKMSEETFQIEWKFLGSERYFGLGGPKSLPDGWFSIKFLSLAMVLVSFWLLTSYCCKHRLKIIPATFFAAFPQYGLDRLRVVPQDVATTASQMSLILIWHNTLSAAPALYFPLS